MTTLQTVAVVGADRVLRLAIPCNLPPGPVEVVVIVSSADSVSRETGMGEATDHLRGEQEHDAPDR